MKKIIIFSLIAVMSFSFVLATPILADNHLDGEETSATTTNIEVETRDNIMKALSSSFERILSPDQIPNFDNIMKKGKDLFGVRKMEQNREQNQNGENEEEGEQNRERALEKIAAPQFINMYEEIKKVGNSLWGYKKGDVNNENVKENNNISDRLEELRQEIHIKSPSDLRFFTNIRKSMDGKLFGILKDNEKIPGEYEKEVEDGVNEFSEILEAEKTCVLAAIEEKDEALKANNLKFVEDLNTAIEERSSCQKEALDSDNQKEAVMSCIENFKESQKEIRDQARISHQSFWSSYKETLTECREENSTSSPIIIEDGGVEIFE